MKPGPGLMMIGRNEFELSAQRFVSLCHPDLYNVCLQLVDKECFVKFSLDKSDDFRIDVVIALSSVYSVPQIYFRVFKNGQLIQNIDTVRGLLGNMETFGEDAYQNAIGIDYDPCDGLGCFFVHPCRVGEVIGEMPRLATEDYLLSFWNLYHI